DGVDVVVLERLAVVVGQRVAQGLLPSRLLAQPGFEDAAGRFAGAESRDAHLAGDLAEGGVEGALELRFVDFHRELDLVALEGLDDRLHTGRAVYRRRLQKPGPGASVPPRWPALLATS